MFSPYKKLAKLSLNLDRLSCISCKCMKLASRSAIESDSSAKAGSSDSKGNSEELLPAVKPWPSLKEVRELGRSMLYDLPHSDHQLCQLSCRDLWCRVVVYNCNRPQPEWRLDLPRTPDDASELTSLLHDAVTFFFVLLYSYLRVVCLISSPATRLYPQPSAVSFSA